eukprot:344315_1
MQHKHRRPRHKNKSNSNYIKKKWNNKHNGCSNHRLSYGGWWTPPQTQNSKKRCKRGKKKQIREQIWRDSEDWGCTLYDIHIPYDTYENIPVWQCGYCSYKNIEKLSFCSYCNIAFTRMKNDIPFPFPFRYKHKNKRKKRIRNTKKKQLKNKHKNDFAMYWSMMPKIKQYQPKNYPLELNLSNHLHSNTYTYELDIISNRIKKQYKHCINIEMTVILEQISEYIFMNELTIAPKEIMNDCMKMKNMIFKQCSIKIENANQNKITYIKPNTIKSSLTQPNIAQIGKEYFEPISFDIIPYRKDNSDVYIPIYIQLFDTFMYRNTVSHFKFDYNSELVQCWKNKPLFDAVKQCFWSLFDGNIKDEIKFCFIDEHYPICNLLPLSCELKRLLFDYIPSLDILNGCVIPYVGYNLFYYIRMNAMDVIVVSKDKQLNIRYDNINVNGIVDIEFSGSAYAQSLTPDMWYIGLIESMEKKRIFEIESSSYLDAGLLFGDDSSSDSSDSSY